MRSELSAYFGTSTVEKRTLDFPASASCTTVSIV